MNAPDTSEILRRLIARIPDACLIETDADGILTRFDEPAERFFGCRAHEVIGRLHYRDLHDRAEMEACRDDPAFRRAMEQEGWTEADWRVIPRRGEPFQARVTLMRAPAAAPTAVSAPRPGWIALYRRISPGGAS